MLPVDDLAGFRERIGAMVAEMLPRIAQTDDPADLELFAAQMLAPFQVPDMQDDVAAVLVESVEQCADERAAGVLAAIAALAREPLATEARAALERLRGTGAVSPLEAAVGTLAVREAKLIDAGDQEFLIAVLERPDAKQRQLAIVIVDRAVDGGTALDGALLPLATLREVRTAVAEAEQELGRGAPISPAELAERLRAAVGRAAECGITVSHELATALPVLARALTGDAAAFASVYCAHLDMLQVGDEETFERVAGRLIEDFLAGCGRDAPVARWGEYVVGSMLDWKWGYGDRCLALWTLTDLEAYLLDFFPRKLSADDELIADVPACVVSFLRFLDACGVLAGDPLEELAGRVGELEEEFEAAALDRRNWGPAKALMTQMLAEGVEPTDQATLDAWMEDFNARPWAERDRVLGPSLERLRDDGGRGRRSRPPRKRAKRKSARAARRVNRRDQAA